MRILAGRFRGRDLRSPADRRVRPTAEPIRGYLLDRLADDVRDAWILDLFAGTGALGLEALSRGARTADFVEWNPGSLVALKANVARFGLRERTRIFKRDAVAFAEQLDGPRYGVAFCDPPYESRILDRVVAHWQVTRFARVLAVEHAVGHALPAGQAHHRFGDTALTLYRA